MRLPSQTQLQRIYGECTQSKERYGHLADCFLRTYHGENAEFFTAPGRTEIIGNHTDHNGGMVIAGSIDMDTIGAALPNDTRVVRITSEGYENEIVIDLEKSDHVDKLSGTEALVAGMMEGAVKYGFQVSGFDAYIATNVIPAAGVSSSASFEMLICSIINHFFNNGAMTYTDYGKIGRYAENIYWKKSSGLLDQMACAVGGAVLFDFSDSNQPQYRKMNFSFDNFGYQLVIVNTGKSHADLSHEYSEIPIEMREAAAALNVKLLHETTKEALMEHCMDIPNDRSILRALHFFEENERVKRAVTAIETGNSKELLSLIEKSGASSWQWLQNCYSLQNCREQKVPLMLALSKLFLEKIGDGACRIHGGGFAGVIMCLIPREKTAEYVHYISKYVGQENVYPMNIRKTGAVHISETEPAL